ncbi:MAG: phosphatase PAP2 family protein [Planctomycetota bacterium]
MNFPSRNRYADIATLYRPVTLLYMAAITMLLVPLLTLIDLPVARYFSGSPLPRDLDSALELSLVFSHGTGVFLVLLSVILMAPRRRWHVARLATLALGGGAIATIVKMFVIRPRPNQMNLYYAGQETAWLWAFDWDLSQIASFDHATRAFPSGNVVTATALTIGLWIVLPRGRVLFATVWMGVLLQRLNAGSHFLSDVCGGVAFGLLWSYVCFHPGLLGSLLDKLVPERRRRQPLIPVDKMSRPATESGAGTSHLSVERPGTGPVPMLTDGPLAEGRFTEPSEKSAAGLIPPTAREEDGQREAA